MDESRTLSAYGAEALVIVPSPCPKYSGCDRIFRNFPWQEEAYGRRSHLEFNRLDPHTRPNICLTESLFAGHHSYAPMDLLTPYTQHFCHSRYCERGRAGTLSRAWFMKLNKGMLCKLVIYSYHWQFGVAGHARESTWFRRNESSSDELTRPTPSPCS